MGFLNGSLNILTIPALASLSPQNSSDTLRRRDLTALPLPLDSKQRSLALRLGWVALDFNDDCFF
ncbi:MAG: hypothetical protein ACK5CA_12365 [Cyanobacteriota bacterium]